MLENLFDWCVRAVRLARGVHSRHFYESRYRRFALPAAVLDRAAPALRMCSSVCALVSAAEFSGSAAEPRTRALVQRDSSVCVSTLMCRPAGGVSQRRPHQPLGEVGTPGKTTANLRTN